MSSWILTIISGGFFFVTPLTYGFAIHCLTSIFTKNSRPRIINFLVSGHVFIFAILLITKLTLDYYSAYFAWPLVMSVLVWSSLVSVPILIVKMRKFISREVVLVVIASLILGGWSQAIISWRTDYTLNWDLYEHQTLVNQIMAGNIDFFTTNMSDSFGFNAYPPVFHSTLAVAEFFLVHHPDNILQFWKLMDGIMTVMVGVAAYSLAKETTKSGWVAVFSLISSILFFESNLAFSNYFFMPQTYTAVLGILYLAMILRKKPTLAALLGMCIGLFLTHYVIGTVAACMLMLAWIMVTYSDQIEKINNHYSLLSIGIPLGIIAVYFTYSFDLTFINHGESQHYLFSLTDKLRVLTSMYGYFGVLAMIGLIDLIRKNDVKSLFLSSMNVLGLVIIGANVPYVFKFLTLFRYFFFILFALGIWRLLTIAKFKIAFIGTALSLVCLLSIALVMNSAQWKQWLLTGSGFSHLNADTVSAAVFLNHAYQGQAVTIFSDPATQNVLEGLSGVNSVGGAVPDREQFYDILHQHDLRMMAVDIRSVKDGVIESSSDRKVFVVSGKTRLWAFAERELATRFDWYLWQPHFLTKDDLQFIQDFITTTSAHLVYQNPTLAVIEL